MIKRKVKKTIAILILIVMFFPKVPIDAITVDEAGDCIASYAESFCKTLGCDSGTNDQTIYDYNNPGEEDSGDLFYQLKKSSGVARPSKRVDNTKYPFNYSNLYAFECSAFVQTMIHQSLGIGGDTFTEFAWDGASVHGSFETKPVSDLKRGDLITNSGHIMIYLGDNRIAHGSWNTSGSNSKEMLDGTASGAKLGTKSSVEKIMRITPDAAAAIKKTDCKKSFDGAGLLGSSMGTESEFYYNGVPDGKYSVAGSFWEWLVEALKDIFSFLVNIIFYIIRMVFVGFTAITDNLISYIVKSVMGVDAKFFEDATSGWKNDGGEKTEKVNIETIIYDDIFDINFFKPGNTAGATAP